MLPTELRSRIGPFTTLLYVEHSPIDRTLQSHNQTPTSQTLPNQTYSDTVAEAAGRKFRVFIYFRFR